MSETEELEFNLEHEAAPAPKKKIARKSVRRGSARKKAVKKDEAPAEAGAEPTANNDADASDEKPAAPKKKVARKRAARKVAAKAEPESKAEAEDIPQVFSADPDDVDDYGDREARKSRDKEQSRDDDNDDVPSGKRDNDDAQGAKHSDNNPTDGGNDRSGNGGGSNQHNRQDNRPNQQNRQGNNDKYNRRDKNQGGKPHWQPKGNKNFKKGNFQPGNQGGKKGKFNKNQRKKGFFQPAGGFAASSDDDFEPPVYDSLIDDETLNSAEAFDNLRAEKTAGEAEAIDFTAVYQLNLPDLEQRAKELGAEWEGAPAKKKLLRAILDKATNDATPVRARGIVELAEDGYGFLVYQSEQYRILAESAFIHSSFVDRYGLQRGHIVDVLLHAPRENETTPFIIGVEKVMDADPDLAQHLTPFTELVPYYPLERILLECPPDEADWDNKSMRIVDLLTPIGLGQRGLIVAPPRTGKTVLLQAMANAITKNRPNVHLIILLIDERPEEVTDFRRQVETAEVISSTFDESAESHVHAAEMVIEKSRRMIESGKDVVILLDSITRLARAYNTLMPSSGKILSGGVEAGALQKPKRFFGSARNIEDGGSLTILGTALVDTGSKMDEVIFEEFKGTGNMELHLDRELVNKRIYPALNFEKSGTRKEELLYHPHEMEKIYGLRRAMKGVPSTEAMEMLITRIKKTKTNAEFLMAMGR